jgi:hypothetical protein
VIDADLPVQVHEVWMNGLLAQAQPRRTP